MKLPIFYNKRLQSNTNSNKKKEEDGGGGRGGEIGCSMESNIVMQQKVLSRKKAMTTIFEQKTEGSTNMQIWEIILQ